LSNFSFLSFTFVAIFELVCSKYLVAFRLVFCVSVVYYLVYISAKSKDIFFLGLILGFLLGVKPCLVPKKYQTIFKILRHVESYGICINH